jgi:hypothetical protein
MTQNKFGHKYFFLIKKIFQQTIATTAILGSITLIFLSLHVVQKALPSSFHDIENILSV